MANNLIRVKQLDQSELSGFFAQTAINTGIVASIVNSIGTGIFVSVSGDQNVSGIKTFFNSINISGDLTVNGSIRANEIIDFTVTGDISGYTGQFQALYVKGEPVVTGSVATASSLFQTGENLYNYINALSGTLNNSGAVLYTYITQLSGDFDTSGAILNSYINNLSGYVTGTDATLANNLANTGSTLDVKINNLSGDFNQTGALLHDYIRALSGTLSLSGSVLNDRILNLSGDFNQTGALLHDYIRALSGTLSLSGSVLNDRILNLSGDFNQTGALLNNYINDLSGVSVLKYGDQTISGNKTFNNTITTRTISGLSGVGGNPDSISLNGIDNAFNIFSSNFAGGYINLNAGSGNFAGGYIFLNGGKQGNTSYGGAINVNGNVNINGTNSSELASRTINIYKTGIVFGNPAAINALTIDNNNVSLNAPGGGGQGFGLLISGVPVTPALYATITNLASTGSTLDTKITNLSGVSVLRFGDQTISGVKTFIGNHIISGDTIITGHLSATSKSFLIDHPTQIHKKLQYGSLEGPEHGVFVRGKTNENIINLPNYWPSLVDENSISVNLTPISAANNIYVVDYNNSRITTNGNNGNDYFYTVYGERKDIPKLTVEF